MFTPYRLYPIFYQELIFMSESTITHSANGVTCTIEMTADEYLVSSEPLLRMAAEADDQSRAEGYIAAWRVFLGL